MKNVQANVAKVVACAGMAGLALLAAPASGELVYGVSSTQGLVSFNSAAPGTILSNMSISGLQAGETIRGIDFRPANGGLYALGSSSRLYTLNTTTGAATMVGGGTFSPALNGMQFGFDFNPTIDRIRVVSDANQNTVLHPDTGAGTGVTSVFYGPGDVNENMNPNIVGSAYTRNFVGGGTTQLYGIDSNLDILVTQANSAGTLATVGALGADFGNDVGFDISPAGIAYVSNRLAIAPQTHFFTINLATGQTSLAGIVGDNLSLDAIAVTPAPATLALLGVAGVFARRRR
jgi:hypothetical protein